MLNLKSFGVGNLSNTKTLLEYCKSKGITTIDGVILELDSQIESERGNLPPVEKKIEKGLHIPCSKCGSNMRVYPVNDKASTQVGGRYTVVGICTNSKCMQSDFHTPESLVKIANNVMYLR